MIIDNVHAKFKNLYGSTPLLVRSPGRVNLIGEHTDYNEGFVLPAAVDKAIYYAIAPSGSSQCRLFANDLNDSYEFSVNEVSKSVKSWTNYLLGVVAQLQKAGYDVGGFDCVFGGDIPIGAGMSSSAAIEGGLAFALSNIFNLGVEKIDMVKMAQKAEHEYAGVMCGIMDQFINIFGADKKVLKLDCRSLEYEYYPFEFDNIDIVLCDTQVSHSLASSEYNIRRQQCESSVAIMKKTYPDINSLRDVSIEMLNKQQANIDPLDFKRCSYVVHENDRLLNGCIDLQNGNLKAFGEKMYKTHAGLSDDYGVSCAELDFLVNVSLKEKGVLGARMMGGGFGGCTINLVAHDAVEDFTAKATEEYKTKLNKDLKVYITHIKAGTSVI